MTCLLGHKYIELKEMVICEKCGKVWHEKKEEASKPAIILKKEPLNLESILEDAKDNPSR